MNKITSKTNCWLMVSQNCANFLDFYGAFAFELIKQKINDT